MAPYGEYVLRPGCRLSSSMSRHSLTDEIRQVSIPINAAGKDLLSRPMCLRLLAEDERAFVHDLDELGFVVSKALSLQAERLIELFPLCPENGRFRSASY